MFNTLIVFYFSSFLLLGDRFAHNLNDTSIVARIFDMFLSHHPIMPLYLSAAVVLSQKRKLLAMPMDYAAVHEYFQDLEKVPINWDEMVSNL